MAITGAVGAALRQEAPYQAEIAMGAQLIMDFAGLRTGGRPYYWHRGTRYADLRKIPGWSFSRTGAAFGKNQLGDLVLFGSNEPRVTDRGLLVEPLSTNALPNSAFAGTAAAGVVPTSWLVTGSQGGLPLTLSQPQRVKGASAQVMQIRRVGASAGYEGLQPASAVALPVGTHSISLCARRPSGVAPCDLQLYTQGGAPGTITLVSAAALSAAPADVWVEYPLTFTLTSAGQFALATTPGGSAGMGLDIALPNLEINTPQSTTYIETPPGGTATRALDTPRLSMIDTLLSSVGGQGFTVLSEVDVQTGVGSSQVFTELSDGTTNNRLRQYRDGVQNVGGFTSVSGGGNNSWSGVNRPGARTMKQAVRVLSGGTVSAAVDGGALNSTVGAPLGLNALYLGRTTEGLLPLAGYVRRLMILPPLDDASLQRLSA